MSYPILYKANETDFTHLGLGVLSDAISALVTEERNGRFELVMKYPIDGALFKEIKNDRLIKVDASNNLKDQRFKIVRITKPAKGLVTVYADHVSYLTQDLQLEPEVTYFGDATTALEIWSNNIVDDHPFTTYSDISTQGSGKWSISEVENARKALGGISGSLLDTYGGEYRFDNYHIGLYRQRGNDSGALIAYGKNLTDLEQEEEIASTYTSIYPYSIIHHEDGTEEILTLPERFIDSEYVNNYARRKILTVDFTNEKIQTVEQLRTRSQQYILDNNIGVPKVNLRVKFIDLSKTLDYKNLKTVEEINLCDLVTVYFEKLDIRRKAKVIKTVWDVLLDRYDLIEIGEAKASLTTSINTVVDGRLEQIEGQLNIVHIAANGKNKIFRGFDMPEISMSKNDIWYKPVGDGEVEMYIYNGEIWELAAYSADALQGTINAANVNVINLNADNMTTGTLTGGKVRLNLNNGTLLIGDSVEEHSLYFDGNKLSLKLSSGKTVEETINNISIGARNLLLFSQNDIMFYGDNVEIKSMYNKDDGFFYQCTGNIDLYTGFTEQRFTKNLTELDRVTISLEVRSPEDSIVSIDGNEFEIKANKWTKIWATKKFSGTNTNRYSNVFTPFSRKPIRAYELNYRHVESLTSTSNRLEYRNMQFEEGDKATTHQIAPEELDIKDIKRNVSELILTSEQMELVLTRYEDGVLVGTSYTFDGDYATFKGAGLKIQNEHNEVVLRGDTDGDLDITGSFTTHNNGRKAIELRRTNLYFYDWYDGVKVDPVGALYSTRRNRDMNIPGIALRHGEDSYLSLGRPGENSNVSYMTFDKFGILNNTIEGFPIRVYENMVFPYEIGIGLTARHRIYEASNNQRLVFRFDKDKGFAIASDASGNPSVIQYDPGMSPNPLTMWERTQFNEYVYINDDLFVTGSKNSLQKTNNYGDRLINAYETADYYFGDIGSGKLNEDGLCYIHIDDIFQECVNTEIEYHVFLQKNGKGDIWVKERNETYFVIEGSPNLEFSWELKAKRKGYENVRLEQINTFKEQEKYTADFKEVFFETQQNEEELLELLTDVLQNDLAQQLLQGGY